MSLSKDIPPEKLSSIGFLDPKNLFCLAPQMVWGGALQTHKGNDGFGSSLGLTLGRRVLGMLSTGLILLPSKSTDQSAAKSS